MSCFTIATMNGDTLASATTPLLHGYQRTAPIIGMMFMICGLSATMSSGDSDAISGVTILLTDVYPSVTGKTIKEEDYAKYSRIALICTLALPSLSPCSSTTLSATSPPSWALSCRRGWWLCCWAASWKRCQLAGRSGLHRLRHLLGVLILVLPSFKNWINATMGGPAVPATIILWCSASWSLSCSC